MKHEYSIEGMSCMGCQKKAERLLNEVPGISATVSLDPPVATVEMEKHVHVNVLQQALSKESHYKILEIKPGMHHKHVHHSKPEVKEVTGKGTGIYYCPMHCEGNKTYDKPGHCPVCGMDLVQEISEGVEETNPVVEIRKNFIISVIFTIPVFILAMGTMIPGNFLNQAISPTTSNWIQFVLSIPVVYACRTFFVRAWQSFKTWKLNMFSLIGLGAGAGFIFSIAGLFFPGIFPAALRAHDGSVHLYFEAVVVILTLVMLGQWLEARAHSQTGSAIRELLKLAPSDALVVRDGKEERVAINDILVGDIIRVKPGEKIPVDGKITEGTSSIDESMITGEPIPLRKEINDAVTAGTINGNQSFLMEAEKVGENTLLSQIIHMVNNASRSRAPIQKLADRISQYFVPAVIGIAVITFFLWWLLGGERGFEYGWMNALAVLIVACPCALGLATPMSVMVGVGKGARNGILIKNAEALELMDKIKVLIIDKTGTITEGKPALQNIIPSGNVSEEELLGFAAAVNMHSEHPLAESIIRKAKEKGIALVPAEKFEAITGKGVSGMAGNNRILLGNAGLLKDHHVEINNDLLSKAAYHQKLGRTVSFLSINDKVAGFLVIYDPIKSTSKSSIHALRAMGIDVRMLTGDHENTAGAVAGELELIHYTSQALPADKLHEIETHQKSGVKVAMAGDGINDAPALAKADVGIAMGTGTDVAIESASITLVKGDLNGIVKARILSRQVMKNIRQNLFFAFIYNIIGIPVAAGILYPFFGILMSPMIAAAAMSLSSVSVIVNSLRLRNTNLVSQNEVADKESCCT